MSEINTIVKEYIAAQRELLDIFEARLEAAGAANDEEKYLYSYVPMENKYKFYFEDLKSAKVAMNYIHAAILKHKVITLEDIVVNQYGLERETVSDRERNVTFSSGKSMYLDNYKGKYIVSIPADKKED